MHHLFSKIIGVGSYVPEKVYTNEDLSKMMTTSDEWIKERSGISQRHIAAVGEGTSDLAVNAARAAIENAGLGVEDIDLVVAATLSPDYYFPGIGVMIQNKLGAKTIPGMDIRGQCSGFAWSLTTADSMIKCGLYKRVLVVGAEIHSRLVEFSDRGRAMSVLFGDGAGAAVLEAVEHETNPLHDAKASGFIDHYMGGDGHGAELLGVLRPGMDSVHPDFYSAQEGADKAYLPVMDGPQVFKNAVKRMAETADALLERNNISTDDIDLLIPHQANIRISESLRTRLKLDKSKVFNNIHRYGNTTAATLPLCMDDAVKEGRLKKGDLVMTVAFGAGFTWGGNLLRW